MVVVVLCAHMFSCLGLRESCVSSFVGIKSGFFFVSFGFAPVFITVFSWVCFFCCASSILVDRSFCCLGCGMRSSRRIAFLFFSSLVCGRCWNLIGNSSGIVESSSMYLVHCSLSCLVRPTTLARNCSVASDLKVLRCP